MQASLPQLRQDIPALASKISTRLGHITSPPVIVSWCWRCPAQSVPHLPTSCTGLPSSPADMLRLTTATPPAYILAPLSVLTAGARTAALNAPRPVSCTLSVAAVVEMLDLALAHPASSVFRYCLDILHITPRFNSFRRVPPCCGLLPPSVPPRFTLPPFSFSSFPLLPLLSSLAPSFFPSYLPFSNPSTTPDPIGLSKEDSEPSAKVSETPPHLMKSVR